MPCIAMVGLKKPLDSFGVKMVTFVSLCEVEMEAEEGGAGKDGRERWWN